jgi:hypothetical protein
MRDLRILTAAYNLLGDGSGEEWDDNPEYKRAIVELVSDLLGVPEEGRPELLDLIYRAGQTAQIRGGSW